MAASFSGKGEATLAVSDAEVPKLHAKIGQLVVERGFFAARVAGMSLTEKRAMIDPEHPRLSILRQCALASIARSSFYRAPGQEDEATLALMRVIDEAFLEMPWYGSRQMTRHLRRGGLVVNRKRVRRLMRIMGRHRSTSGRGRAIRTPNTGYIPTCCAGW